MTRRALVIHDVDGNKVVEFDHNIFILLGLVIGWSLSVRHVEQKASLCVRSSIIFVSMILLFLTIFQRRPAPDYLFYS